MLFLEAYQTKLRKRKNDTKKCTKQWLRRPKRKVRMKWKKNYVLVWYKMIQILELKEAQEKKKKLKQQIRHEEEMVAAVKVWNQDVIPRWESQWVSPPWILLRSLFLWVNDIFVQASIEANPRFVVERNPTQCSWKGLETCFRKRSQPDQRYKHSPESLLENKLLFCLLL